MESLNARKARRLAEERKAAQKPKAEPKAPAPKATKKEKETAPAETGNEQ